MYDLRYQVKQYVAEIQGKYCKFKVFETGDSKYYLFCQIYNGCDTGLHIPILKKDLKPDIKGALAHGHGWGTL